MLARACKLSWLLIIAAAGYAQNTPPHEKCEFNEERAQDVRRIAGGVPATYYFACLENNPNAGPSGCIEDTIKPGLLVSVNRNESGWSCISGESTSGWVQTSTLEAIPSEPRIPLNIWEGWWQHPAKERVKGERNDRLLITATKEPGVLSVSGRAYWYGIGNVVHYGQMNGEARATGKYLRAVEGGCVLDLEFISSNPAEVQAHQNAFQVSACGGMNASFSGTWVKFTPRSTKVRKGSTQRKTGAAQIDAAIGVKG